MNERKERQVREELKAAALRSIADQQWSVNDLLAIFGMALRAKIADTSNRHNRIGKHYFNAHDQKARRHPAGTKLVRGFIRRSGRESTAWRNMYFDLTGKHYGTTATSA